jgi:phosphoserine phosphatase
MTTQTLLVTLSGADKPGVTKALFTALGGFPVTVADVEQLVIRGQLVLTVLVGFGDDPDLPAQVRTAVRQTAASLDLDVTTVLGANEDGDRRRNRVHVTVLGASLPPIAIARIAQEVADRGGNIDRIRRIAAYPVTAIVFESSGAEVHDLRRALTSAAVECGVDVAVQAAGLDRRGQYLVVMDVDSTLIQDEVIDLIAEQAGVLEDVARITDRAMAGELDFTESLTERVRLLAGLPVAALEEVRSRVSLTPGARTLCRTLNNLGYRVCLVSGGFIEVVGALADELGVAGVRANVLEVVDGRLTGRVVGPIIDRAGKRRALEEFAAEFSIPMRRTIAIGDGANDIDMLEAAGLGVAFNAKAPARAAADTAVNVPYLDSVLYLLGITREDIEEADARDGLVTPSPAVG